MTLERIDELKTHQAVIGYTLFMTIWIVAFARTERALPAVLVLVLLLLPAVVHFGLGYVVADWRALYLAAVPVVVAAVAGGLPSAPLGRRRAPDRIPGRAARRGRRLRARLARAARSNVRRSLADLGGRASLPRPRILGRRGARAVELADSVGRARGRGRPRRRLRPRGAAA